MTFGALIFVDLESIYVQWKTWETWEILPLLWKVFCLFFFLWGFHIGGKIYQVSQVYFSPLFDPFIYTYYLYLSFFFWKRNKQTNKWTTTWIVCVSTSITYR